MININCDIQEKNKMDEFTVIKVMNEARIEILKEKNDDYSLNVKDSRISKR